MDLQYLDNFLALAHYRSFSAAADACYISQSSFSKRIMRLENNLGVTLFERSTRQVSLTEYGQIYLKYAQQIKTLSRQARMKSTDVMPKTKVLSSAVFHLSVNMEFWI